MDVRLTLLGPVTYLGAEIGGSRLRGLLALLADDLRNGCGTTRLIEALWPYELPEHPAKALQTVVSRARARLGADVIVSTPTGYRLALLESEVDSSAVLIEAAAAELSTGPETALAHADAGLAMFAAFAGFAEGDENDDGPVGALRRAREPARQRLKRVRALALARLGRSAEAVGALLPLVERSPLDEELLLALLRNETPTAALSRYDDYRRALRERLGRDPGPELQRLHRELLLSDSPAERHGVRHEPNQLLGRDRDIAAVLALLDESRVVSVVGPGGLGKTRLAHAVARAARQRVVYFVELAGVADDRDVIGEVAAALGVGDAGTAEAEKGAGRIGRAGGGGAGPIVDALKPATALLVLDNCEHLLHGTADLVRELISLTPDVRVLTTSRAPLDLSSESVYPLPELGLPTMVELFERRARAARPNVDLAPAAVRDLCARLDGLPLAAELAAARVRAMSVGEMARRLDDRFALLRGGGRDSPERHRTLHAVIDWSWHLLGPDDQAAMRALSIFPGGFTASAAAFLTGDDTVIERLVDQSLIKVFDIGAETRFRMLETVREFGVARREEAGETPRVVDRFLGWARDFGLRRLDAELGAGLTPAADLTPAVAVIRAEQDNLLPALRYALDREDGPTVAITAALLGLVWLTESNLARLATLAADVSEILARVRPAEEVVEAVRMTAVVCAVGAYLTRGHPPRRALVTLRRLPPPDEDTVVGAAQRALGATDLPSLRGLADSDRPLVAVLASYALSYVAESGQDFDLALSSARRMLVRLPAGATPWIRALAHARIGELCLQSDPAGALHHLGAAMAIMEELGAVSSAARARWAMVLAHLQRGAFDEAERGLDQLGEGSLLEEAGRQMFDTCARAEILLGRGDVDGGLALWREAAARLRDRDDYWAREVRGVAVVAHARFGRPELVGDLAAALPGTLAAMLATATTADLPACGSVLLATNPSDVRVIALAERLGFRQDFQPTMSSARLREVAMTTDPRTYAEAVSAYAGLDEEGLLAAARSAAGIAPEQGPRP
ncbi:ATP-binding protein [Actinoplanes sp. CA-030573]|uniref:ATP-binding protein n=1 Tax=Actinoplanes sp. CA-030573 TaxID=3239898 RepID=UPI003D919C99